MYFGLFWTKPVGVSENWGERVRGTRWGGFNPGSIQARWPKSLAQQIAISSLRNLPPRPIIICTHHKFCLHTPKCVSDMTPFQAHYHESHSTQIVTQSHGPKPLASECAESEHILSTWRLPELCISAGWLIKEELISYQISYRRHHFKGIISNI